LRRADTVLLVQSEYPGEALALWTLPGGRRQPDETIGEAVAREFLEETSLRVRVGQLAYVSESLDEQADLHVVNFTFHVRAEDNVAPRPADPAVREARFVPVAEAADLLQADVLRIPVSAALSQAGHPGYFSFRSSDISVPFFGRG
jgi:ADP-ribose pyrophosphatase YjhB (NUDIX family)